MQSHDTLEHAVVGRTAVDASHEESHAERKANATEGWTTFPLRIMLAVGFLVHGLPKLYSAAGHAQFAQMLASLSVPAPDFSAWVIGVVEVGAAVSIGLGLLSRLASIVLIVEMVVAAILVHGPAGFNFIHVIGTNAQGPVFGLPGYEVNLIYIAMLLALLVGGPGKLSVTSSAASRWLR